MTTASEAWELLAARGLIPLSWINNTQRGFVQPIAEICKPCNGSGMTNAGWSNCYECNATGSVFLIDSNLTSVLETPPDLATCAALASMADSVATAEVLVRDFAARLAALGIEGGLGDARPLRWRLSTESSMDGTERRDKTGSAVDDRESSHQFDHGFHRELSAGVPKTMQSVWANYDLVRARATRLVYAHLSWETRAKRGERLRSLKSLHCGELLSSLSNPYSVGLEVCALGLAIEDVFNGVAFILVPPIGRR